MKSPISNVQANLNDSWLRYLLWNYHLINVTAPYYDESILVQVMAWCRQATSHYLNQCWPRPLSPNGVTRPQWVNDMSCAANRASTDFTKLYMVLVTEDWTKTPVTTSLCFWAPALFLSTQNWQGLCKIYVMDRNIISYLVIVRNQQNFIVYYWMEGLNIMRDSKCPHVILTPGLKHRTIYWPRGQYIDLRGSKYRVSRRHSIALLRRLTTIKSCVIMLSHNHKYAYCLKDNWILTLVTLCTALIWCMRIVFFCIFSICICTISLLYHEYEINILSLLLFLLLLLLLSSSSSLSLLLLLLLSSSLLLLSLFRRYTLKTESCHDANFGDTGGSSLACQPTVHHDNF